MPDHLQLRLHGSPPLPTLIYLPGLHGNWCLVGGFRRALAGRVRFVEISYPDTLFWSLDDHAEAVEAILVENGIQGGWLLAESFGSQIAWTLLARGKILVEGLVLAGGFVQHPWRPGARLAQRIFNDSFFPFIRRAFSGYARVSRLRFWRSPETINEIQEFVAGLTPQVLRAFKHRLQLVAESDLRTVAQRAQITVFGLSGLFDPIVPWLWVRGWMKKNCPTLKQYRIVWSADHNVLGTAPIEAAEQVLRWMRERSMKQDPRTKSQVL